MTHQTDKNLTFGRSSASKQKIKKWVGINSPQVSNTTHTKNLSQTNKLFVIQVRILQVLGQL